MHELAGKEYLWHGVTWASGHPAALLADTKSRQLHTIQIIGQSLGLKVVNRDRFCTGRYGFIDTHHVEPVPCPAQAKATSSGQCAACSAQDEFRHAHQFHRGGYCPASLSAYMAQPHWLYIATFANSASKVGTAAAPRKVSRLNEQGPTYATYVAHAPDGRAVRDLEDAVSTQLGIPQTTRGSRDTDFLFDYRLSEIHDAHRSVIAAVAAALRRIQQTPTDEAWTCPPESTLLRTPAPHGRRAAYPFQLREGEHGFYIDACLGGRILARLSPDVTATQYVLSLNALKGHRVLFGDFSSPETAHQESLF